MTHHASAWILAAFVALSSCGAGGVSSAGLAEARTRWTEADVGSYRFRLDVSDEWLGDRAFLITVVDGDVAEIASIRGEPEGSLADFSTVPRLFDSVERWWVDDSHASVTFHDNLGYPVLIESDDPGADDDAIEIRISELEALDS